MSHWSWSRSEEDQHARRTRQASQETNHTLNMWKVASVEFANNQVTTREHAPWSSWVDVKTYSCCLFSIAKFEGRKQNSIHSLQESNMHKHPLHLTTQSYILLQNKSLESDTYLSLGNGHCHPSRFSLWIAEWLSALSRTHHNDASHVADMLARSEIGERKKHKWEWTEQRYKWEWTKQR